MTRLLILSAGAGAGHNRAAEALHGACEAHFSSVESEWMDSLKFTSKIFRTLYADSYLFMANYSPSLWGFLYKKMGKKGDRKGLEKLVKTYDKVAYRKLMAAVDGFKADAVVCTHFLPANVLITHKRHCPVYITVTDYDVHSFWVNRKADGYFVASDEVRWQLRGYGYPDDRIRVTGIPVHPSFSVRMGTDEIRRRLGLKTDSMIVLFMSGGFGVGDLRTAVERIINLEEDFQLVVVCGRNEKLRKRVKTLVRGARGRLTVLGFIKNVHEYMEAADFAITKAGGLSVSEGLARGLPMIIFSPIPGQEERNCDYLLERGAAAKAKSVEVLDYKVKELLENPSRLDRMKAAANEAARPHAAREIVGHVLDDLGN